jgi:hypothetical protein
MALNINIDPRASVPQDQMYEKFSIDHPAKIIFVGRHLRTSDTLPCLIRTISLYGAELDVGPDLELPKNFYLELLGIRDEIGCTLIRREDETVTVGFNMLLDPEFLHHVRRLNFETSH